jgi:hypothetical protein
LIAFFKGSSNSESDIIRGIYEEGSQSCKSGPPGISPLHLKIKTKSQAEIYTFTHNKQWKPYLLIWYGGTLHLSEQTSQAAKRSVNFTLLFSFKEVPKHLIAVMYNSHGQTYSALSLLHKEQFIKYYLNTEMKVIHGGQHPHYKQPNMYTCIKI